jgi:hypothetical protein
MSLYYSSKILKDSIFVYNIATYVHDIHNFQSRSWIISYYSDSCKHMWQSCT